MTDAHTATGTFSVRMQPLVDTLVSEGVSLGRLKLSKAFEGGLVATGEGEMLTATTPVPGSAGYVAIERVTGVLDGRHGSFVLQHSGSMGGGSQHLRIEVVPGSGTGELTGMAGEFLLRVEAGQHHYTLNYRLPLK